MLPYTTDYMLNVNGALTRGLALQITALCRSCSDAGEKKGTREVQAPNPSELGPRAEARGASLIIRRE